MDILKKTWRNLLVFLIAIGTSFCLFFLFVHPLSLVFLVGRELSAASEIVNSATVPINPVNKLALQLDVKEKELAEKEKALNERSAVLEKKSGFWRNGLLLTILVLLIVLFILILVNFYFDNRRKKELERLEKGGGLADLALKR